MTDIEPAPDDLVRAALHYTDFADREAFEKLCQRHGLGYAGTDEDEASAAVQGSHMWVANVADRGDLDNRPVDPLTLHAYADPRGERETKVLDDGGYRTEVASGYASYVNIRGPLSAALELYLDVYETAEYIKGEFRPLATVPIGCNRAANERVVGAEGKNTYDNPDVSGRWLWIHRELRENSHTYRTACEAEYDWGASPEENLRRAARNYHYLTDEDFREFARFWAVPLGGEELDAAIDDARQEAVAERRQEERARERSIPRCLRGRWEPDPSRSKSKNARDALRMNPAVSDLDLADALAVGLGIDIGEAQDCVRNARSWAATQPEAVR